MNLSAQIFIKFFSWVELNIINNKLETKVTTTSKLNNIIWNFGILFILR